MSSGVTNVLSPIAATEASRYDARDLSSSSRARLTLLGLAMLTAGACALACGEDADGGGGGSATTDGGASTLPEAAVGTPDAEAPATTMRLAHVAADLGPVDFCYRSAKATAFEGPVLGGGTPGAATDGGGDADAEPADAAPTDAARPDAGATAIAYRTVSRYLTLDVAGPLTLALVEPGATSCASPLLVANVTLDPGKLATVAIVGTDAPDGGPPERTLVAFVDDRSTIADQARVRLINAAFGTPPVPLAVRAVGAQTIALADRLEPKKASAPSTTVPVDALGYATVSPLPSPAQLAISAAAGTSADAGVASWVSSAGELRLQGGSLHTGFVLGGEDGASYEVLWCTDTSTSGDRTTCERVR
jgi:Domain of unknown function (DUF4397)